LTESLQALGLALAQDDLAQIEAAIAPNAVAGTRYDEAQMRWLDSEQAPS